MDIMVNREPNKMIVVCPYNRTFSGPASKKGDYDLWRDAWVFDPRDEVIVREMLRAAYGTDGSESDPAAM